MGGNADNGGLNKAGIGNIADNQTNEENDLVTSVDTINVKSYDPSLTNFIIGADGVNNQYVIATIGELIVNNNSTLHIATTGWGPRHFRDLTIDKLTVDGDNGTVAIDVIASEKATIAQVVGTVSAITNAGTLTIGSEGSAISISGTINNTGTLKLRGDYTFDSAGEIEGSGTVEVMNGSVVTLSHGGATSAVKNNIKVHGGGVLNLSVGDTLGWGGENQGPALLTLAGTGETDAQRAIVNITGKQTQATSIDLQGHAHMKGGEIQLFGCNISASGTDNIITSTIQSSVNACEINVAADGTLEFQGNITRNGNNYNNNGRLTKTGEGTVTFSGADSHFYNVYTHSAGISNFDGDKVYFDGGLTINAGEVNFGGGEISLGDTLVINSGTLDMGGSTIILNSLANFDFEYEVPTNTDTTKNGFALIDKLYTIIDGYSSEKVIGNATFKIGENTVSLSGGIYREAGAGESTTFVINNGSVATDAAEIAGATQFIVLSHADQDAGTLVIKGDAGELNAKSLLVNTSGNGNIELQTSVNLTENDVTKATGTLTIAQGAELNLGNKDLNNSTTQEASLSSFNSIEIDGGHIRVQSKKDTWNNVTVTSKGATLHIEDLANSATDILTLAGTTTLNGNLTMTNNWGERIAIQKLSGTGALIIDDDARSDKVTLTINATENYSGVVKVKQTHDKLALNVAEDAGVHVSFENTTGAHLELENIGAGNSIGLAGVIGHLGNGTTIAADIQIVNSANKAGLELNDGYFAVNTFTGDISGTGNLVINKDRLQNHGLTFTGDVSRWTGRMDVAKGTHTITYTGSAVSVKNVQIEVHNGATANVIFDHDSAATVESEVIAATANDTLNLTVSNSSEAGTTFTNKVAATNVTIGESSVVKFTNGNVQMTNLSTGAESQTAFTTVDTLSVSNLNVGNKATLTANTVSVTDSADLGNESNLNTNLVVQSDATLNMTGKADITGSLEVKEGGIISFGDGDSLSITGSLTLDASAVQLAFDITSATDVVLATTTAGVTLTGAWGGISEYEYEGKTYTVGLSTADNALALVFREMVADGAEISTTVKGYDITSTEGITTLTLSVDAALSETAQVTVDLISDEIMEQILTELDGTAMVGITLLGTNGISVEGTSEGNVLFINEDGESYRGELVKLGEDNVAWQYDVTMIPEPTTTALSLLALCGLAARRRRK